VQFRFPRPIYKGRDNVRNLILFGLCSLLSFSFLIDDPCSAPLTPRKVGPKELPDLAMLCNWGTLSQTGNVLSITGHPQWDAEGSIFRLWTLKSNNRAAPSVYAWDEEKHELNGKWGYAEDVTINKDGTITGGVQGDRIHRVEAAPPAIDDDTE
jgi:hypothetical protein